MSDHYGTLGVRSSATPAEIKKAFRALALKYHPDRNPGDRTAEEKFKAVAGAWKVLSDPASRGEYDAAMTGGGTPGRGVRGAAGDGGSPPFGADGDPMTVDEILRRFGGIFEGGLGEEFHRSRSAARPGRDAEVELELAFATAALGGSVSVSLAGAVPCAACGGRGATGDQPQCPTCHGSGRITAQPRDEGRFFTVTLPCSTCHGTGIDPARVCPECRGEGTLERARTLKIKVPEGSEDGTVLRLAGLGEAGRGGGPPGDLLARLRVPPDPVFRREGHDIHSDVAVPMAVAALGGRMPVATLRGRVNLTIPAGTSSGAQLKLRGRGILGGHHIVRVMVTVPATLTPRQRELLVELQTTAV